MKTLKQIFCELMNNPLYTDNNPGVSGLGVQGRHPYVQKIGDKQWAQPKGEYDVPPDGIQPNEPLEKEEKEELPGNDTINKPAPVGSPVPMMKDGGRNPGRRLGFRRR